MVLRSNSVIPAEGFWGRSSQRLDAAERSRQQLGSAGFDTCTSPAELHRSRDDSAAAAAAGDDPGQILLSPPVSDRTIP